MKKIICILMTLVMTLALCVPVTAADSEPQVYTPTETFTREELLAMDPELDSDGDALADVYEIIFETNRFNPDTDYDGVNDYVELCVTCTDVLVPDGDLDTDGDGLTNAQEGVYGTNADDKDSDNDNLSDYDEIVVHKADPLSKDTDSDGIRDDIELELGLNPLLSSTDGITADVQRNEVIDYFASAEASQQQGVLLDPPSLTPLAVNPFPEPSLGDDPISAPNYSATLTTEYSSFPLTYRLGMYWFFGDNTNYNQQLAITSSILSAIAYDNNYLSYTSYANRLNALSDWFSEHSFTGYARYDLDYDAQNNPSGYTDQHVSEMFVAHREYTYGSETKNIICVVIRGTNGTLDEWQSNFDVGDTADQPTTSGWVVANNHMGFDITARRLNTKLNAYITANGLSGEDNVFWITGHSRGGALANILAGIRSNAGNEVFAYTFAAPATTTAATAHTGANFACIFNIINEDDLVPQLPLTSWEFKRYGHDVKGSIEVDGYADDWDSLMDNDLTYTSNQSSMLNTVDTFDGISDNRDQCYEYRTDGTGFHYGGYLTQAERDMNRDAQIGLYPPNTTGTYLLENYNYDYVSYTFKIYQQPAFLMQLLAAYQGNVLTQGEFVLINVAPYLENSKRALALFAASGAILHPHLPESYYLLATKPLDEE